MAATAPAISAESPVHPDRRPVFIAADGRVTSALLEPSQSGTGQPSAAALAEHLLEPNITVTSARNGIIMKVVPIQVSRSPDAAAEHRRAPHDGESDTLAAQLAGTANRDVAAFTALYDRTCSRTYGVALRVLRDPGYAEEATREVYLQVWNTAHRYDPREGSPLAWMTTLTHRHAVERVRSEPGRLARVLGCGNGGRVGGCHYVIDEVLKPALGGDGASMNDFQRETIALTYYGGLTYREVGEFLGVPQSTITSRIRLGIKRLGEAVARA